MDPKFDTLTPAFLDGLTKPFLGIKPDWSQGHTSLVSISSNSLASNLKTTDQFVHFIPGEDLISRAGLMALAQEVAFDANMALIELSALGSLNVRCIGSSGVGTAVEMMSREAISKRVHQLLDWHPHLLHPNLLVYSSSTRDNCSMLKHLVASGVELDPQLMKRLADRHVLPGHSFIKNLGVPDDQQAELVEFAFSKGFHRISAAHSLLAVFGRPEMVGETIMERLGESAGVASIVCDRQFRGFVKMLELIQKIQDAAGGDDARAEWFMQGGEALAMTDMAWSNAKHQHPVLIMIFKAAATAVAVNATRPGSVAGFPARPIESLAAGLNGILKPEFRLPMFLLSNNQLLKLVTLCAQASEHGSLIKHYREGMTSTAKRMERHPEAIIEWALTRETGVDGPIKVSDIEFDLDRYTKLLGGRFVSEIMAKVTAAQMSQIIDSKTSNSVQALGLDASMESETAASAPARRRSRVL
ncbi:hypothetical protein [Paucibacter soli]|uniref:hypothetical protein n=1 Tax=Paucibacter soli TaxID=3133433 RepID=UPI00309FF72D